MQKALSFLAISCACAGAACGTEIAQAVDIAPASTPKPPVDAGPPGLPEKPPVCTTSKIAERLVFGKVLLSEPVRYKRAASFFGFPQDDRIAFSVSNSNLGQVAWLTNGGSQVHVTPVSPAEFSRATPDVRGGDDVPVDGLEVGGLAALDDGFALLTRGTDPGDVIPESAGQAMFLVRWESGKGVRFAVPLTGTKSVTTTDDEKHDFPLAVSPISLSGRLVFDGTQYGAYFSVRGGTGDRFANQSSDKLVVVDDSGQFVSGWRSACYQNLGARLVFDTTGFVPFCMSDGTYNTAGLFAANGTRNITRLASEVTFSSGGYSGGNLGSAVKVNDGYVVAWATRGIFTSNGTITGAAYDSHEPAIALVTKEHTRAPVANNPRWPFLASGGADAGSDGGTRTRPTEDAVNVHAGAYGDKVLMVWETISSPTFRPSTGVSVGAYGGTHFRLIDALGNIASEEEVVLDSIAPNGPDDIVLFPNGDLGWAYVPEARNFQTFATPGVSTLSEIRFVRLPYCIPP